MKTENKCKSNEYVSCEAQHCAGCGWDKSTERKRVKKLRRQGGGTLYVSDLVDRRRAKAVKVLKTEKECIMRNAAEDCNRNCKKCDLALDYEEIINAYNEAIDVLEREGG